MTKVWMLRLAGWEQPRIVSFGNLESVLLTLDLKRGVAELYLKEMY